MKLIDEIKNPTTVMGRQSAHGDMGYSLHNTPVAAPRSSNLAAQVTPFPEINMSKFGTGRNSIQAQISGNDDSMSLKKDRDYIRRIIQESKDNQTKRANSMNGDGDVDISSPKEESKLKWNKEQNRFTKKGEGREGPSKDHSQTVNYLAQQREKTALQKAYERKLI